ncbi:NAD(P)/FAD-dependent oxidoreductase [Epilithonimonas arachidiradicis]|uniref:Glycine/D-amino acid oxidase-like deaminating enzyme n=1 Tax=Epilithonimonas arachidiradicis TaxID=1617282 RepID=A0A420DEY7_9FLAO|nr:FAD-binding oxidoreductase [Epilithonimonas arachidiradicis]RKE90207.1 glycine/D-amino acid oxidase-like deaminating enzyme [Epilithonimonas arachidiradicis]GGG48561.1 oxidoreductase [Epilithonimonas arachidiradicis]
MKLKSPEPFWLVKDGLKHSYPSLRENIETEILIIGGGITGSLLAHQMIKDGYKTVLVDRREIGNGSTSATTSMLQYEIDIALFKLSEMIGQDGAEKAYWACYNSIDDLQKIAKEVKSDCGFAKKKSLYFAALKKDVPLLKKEFEARKAAGFPVKWLSEEEIKKQFKIENTFGGILSEQGGSIDAFCLAHDILHYNYKKGLEIFDKTDIVKFDYKKNGVTATTDYGNTIKANKVIFCNGFESTEIIKDKFVNLLSTYAIVGEQCDKEYNKELNGLLVWNTANPYIYMRTTDDNRILMGGEDEEFVNAKKRDSLLFEKEEKLIKKINKYLPENNFRTDFVWAGTFGETKDGLPYIGQHPNFPSAYFVLGFGGNGITFSVIGMAMASDFLKGKKHELTKYFRFRR